MDEKDMEGILAQALEEFGAANDLLVKAATIEEKGFGTEPGLIVTLGGVEYHIAITQTVFEEE